MNNKRIIIHANEDVEIRLYQMKDLKEEIKESSAKLDLLKQYVIDSYFREFESYHTKDGLELATYKLERSQRFAQKKFESDHKDIYELYKEPMEIYKFLLK